MKYFYSFLVASICLTSAWVIASNPASAPAAAAVSPDAPLRIFSTISGIHAKAVQLAVVEFEKQQLDLTKYNVTISEENSTYVVVFDPPGRPLHALGSWNHEWPTFNVEIDKATMKVTESSFAR
jgi:hypothetical protein